ncbi:MAG: hypothetical protein ACREDL_07870, partial [Bradyrhizobium sp.]
MAGLEPAHQFVRAMFLHKAVENRPRNKFHDVMEDAILMPHGAPLFRVQLIRKQLESSRINAVHSIKHKTYRTVVAQGRA